jgi:hypothetical protein
MDCVDLPSWASVWIPDCSGASATVHHFLHRVISREDELRTNV